MIRIAHFGDLHASEKTKDESLKALKFIFETCREREVHAILNCGDTFDGEVELGDAGPVNEIVEILSHAPAPLFIIEGTKSHDKPGSVDSFSYLSSYFGITVFRVPNSFPMIFPNREKPSGHISFLPALTKTYFIKDKNLSIEESNQLIAENLRPILADFGVKAQDSPEPHILMAHFEVTGSVYSNKQTILGGDIKLSPADIALANADYVAMSHIHKRQKIEPNIYYAGSPYHLNFGELEDKGFNIVTFDDKGNLADVEFVKTPSRARQTIDAHWNPDSNAWDLSEKPHPGADTRIRLYAPQHQFDSDLTDTMEAATLEAGVHSVKIEKIPTPENRIRAADLSSAKSLRDKLVEYGKIKEIDIPESALLKADQVEEVVS